MAWGKLLALLSLGALGSAAGDDKVLGALEDLGKVRASLPASLSKIDSVFWPEIGIPLDESLMKVEREHVVRKRAADGTLEMVMVEIKARVEEGLLERIRQEGKVLFSSVRYGAITAEVPPGMLAELAHRDEVVRIDGPEVYQTFRATSSEGMVSHRVREAAGRFPQATGKGVRVGVLSDSVDHLGEVQALGDLPADIHVLSNRAGNGRGEGTAMLEVVHDLAPEAELYFATAGSSQAQFATNILDLASAGCQVIVDDILFLGEPVFEDGVVAQAVQEVAAKGVAFFSAAGNYGSTLLGTAKVWEGPYQGQAISLGGSASNYRDALLFAPGQPYAVVSGTSFSISLHWADPLDKPELDLDLLVYTPEGALVSYSARAIPHELVFITGTALKEYHVYVARYQGSAAEPKQVSLRVSRGKLAPFTNGHIYGHAAAEDAFSIAAAPAGKFSPESFAARAAARTLKVESFSSQGPRRIDLVGGKALPAPLIRQKPDFTAANGISTSTPGFSSFYGTSAAAPHAAALAALVYSAVPDMTPARLRALFTATAIDMLSPGWDDVSGHGALDAVLILEAALKDAQAA